MSRRYICVARPIIVPTKARTIHTAPILPGTNHPSAHISLHRSTPFYPPHINRPLSTYVRPRPLLTLPAALQILCGSRSVDAIATSGLPTKAAPRHTLSIYQPRPPRRRCQLPECLSAPSAPSWAWCPAQCTPLRPATQRICSACGLVSAALYPLFSALCPLLSLTPRPFICAFI